MIRRTCGKYFNILFDLEASNPIWADRKYRIILRPTNWGYLLSGPIGIKVDFAILGEMLNHKISDIVTSNGTVYHLGLRSEHIASNLFLVGDPNRAYLVADRFDRIECEIKNREFITLTGYFEQLPVSVIGTGIGTDNVEIALIEAYVAYEFDMATGIRRSGLPKMNIIRIGTSGGIQGNIEPGTMAITSYALGLDSTGLYYEYEPMDQNCLSIEEQAIDLLDSEILPESRFKGKISPYCSKADPKVVSALTEQAETRGIAYELGITVTSPGFYGPSSRRIDGLRNTLPDIKGTLAKLKLGELRVINMEMESSLLYHLAGSIGYAAGTICPIISSPNTSTSIIHYGEKVNQAIDLALGAMVNLRH